MEQCTPRERSGYKSKRAIETDNRTKFPFQNNCQYDNILLVSTNVCLFTGCKVCTLLFRAHKIISLQLTR